MSDGDVPTSQANTTPVAQTPPPGAEIRFRQVRRQMNGKEEILSVPYVVYPQTPSASDPDGSPMDRSSSDDPNVVDPSFPEETTLSSSTSVAGSSNAKSDAATTLIQNWLRSAKDPSDQAELRKLLQDHLQQEFEATQASRKAEVERLQRLLLQSVEWLDKRAKNRDEIIKKRIDELIQNSVSNTPVGR